MAYRVVELKATERPRPEQAFAPRGAAVDFWNCKDPEILLEGPAETGKTWAALQKLNALLWKYPGAQAALIRKTYQSIPGSVLVTFKRIIGEDSPIKAFGGEKPQWYDYPNGSRIWIGGMDNPSRVLSSERDFIYINQAEELSVEDYEVLTTRATGRGGVAPYAQIMGDANPAAPTHWIKHRASLRTFASRHEDNPTLFDADGIITEQGRKSLAMLDSLSGVRYLRLRKGLWVAAEGMVYEEWDTAAHIIDERDPAYGLQNGIPDDWPRTWVVDFGYTHPFVFQAWAQDPDGRQIRYREIYKTGVLVEDHARTIMEITKDDPPPVALITDHDADGRFTLEKHTGMTTTPAQKSVSQGIQAVKSRLKKQGDGKPRLLYIRDSLHEVDEKLKALHKPTCTEEEYESYIWRPPTKTLKAKEEPVKEYDHGMDATRYLVAYYDPIEEEEFVGSAPVFMIPISFSG